MTTAIPARIHVLAKPTGAICNLNCSYCFFLNKERLYPGSHFRMSDEVLVQRSGSCRGAPPREFLLIGSAVDPRVRRPRCRSRWQPPWGAGLLP